MPCARTTTHSCRQNSQKIRFLRKLCSTRRMSSKKKGAPLPASSGGLMRFFEDDTKGFRVDPTHSGLHPGGSDYDFVDD